ncbi:MAG: hypothetical protein NXH75_06170, partial [Halobacteriovoraceae bacterium]|nr:hypothetical protein [Halobacteriovoraceae bacterium]
MLNLTPYIWLFLSGAIALTLEVLWTRYFQILLGNTVYSFSWVTGSFLLGISLGSFLGGLIVKKVLLEDKNKATSLLRYYLISEVVVLLTGMASFGILAFPPEGLIEVLNPKHFLKDGFVSLLFILPTTISMGIGLPIITQRFGNKFKLENLYASNTIGGGLGLLILAFFGVIILGYIGLLITVFVFNLFLIGHITLVLRSSFLEDGMLPIKEEESGVRRDLNKLLFLSFLSGFILLGLEAVWFRTSELILNDRAYISTLVLFIVLTLLGVSSYLTPRIKKNWPNFLPYFLFTGLLSLVGAELLSDQAFLIARDFPRITPQKVAYLFLVFIFPLSLFSFIFPKILTEERWSGRIVAKLIFANTIGGLFGTLLVSYFLIETFRMKSFYLLAFLLIPLFCLLNKKNKVFPFLFILPLILFSSILKGDINIHRESQVLESQELPQGLFSLIKSNKNRLEMYNGNYRIVAPFRSQNGEHAQKALSFFPALFHKSPKKILTMGTGYGISISSFLKLNPSQVDSVEVHPMVNQVSYHFKDLNEEWYLSPKVQTFID